MILKHKKILKQKIKKQSEQKTKNMPHKEGRKPHKNIIRPQTYSENKNTITTTTI